MYFSIMFGLWTSACRMQDKKKKINFSTHIQYWNHTQLSLFYTLRKRSSHTNLKHGIQWYSKLEVYLVIGVVLSRYRTQQPFPHALSSQQPPSQPPSLLTQLDQNEEICCIFFNFQKAFDTVPHRRFMEKLKQLHLHPLIVSWLHSYLT